MRITSGIYKGREIEVPKSGVKPTSDKIRQAIINILKPELSGARLLELYCGTGAVGIEALSAGAAFACFVESNGKVYMVLKRNLEAIVGDKGKYRTVKHNVTQLEEILPVLDLGTFHVVFADPFYKDAYWQFEDLYKLAFRLLKPEGTFMLEHGSKDRFESFAGFVETRIYGDTALTLFRKSGEK